MMAANNSPTVEVAGALYMRDARGALIPIESVNAQDKLEDETVRKIMGYARDLSARIERFKGYSFEDLNSFQSLLEQDYGAKRGGAKGNATYISFDGLEKVQVQIADLIAFGPQIQEAKKLIDECLIEWGAESRPEIRALVNRVFSVEKEGFINCSDIFSLLRLDIDDARWLRAADAIRDSIRIIGSKSYLRFYERDAPDGKWRAITIDIAAA